MNASHLENTTSHMLWARGLEPAVLIPEHRSYSKGTRSAHALVDATLVAMPAEGAVGHHHLVEDKLSKIYTTEENPKETECVHTTEQQMDSEANGRLTPDPERESEDSDKHRNEARFHSDSDDTEEQSVSAASASVAKGV